MIAALVASLLLRTPATSAGSPSMTSGSEDAEAVEKLLETPDLATALESEQFKKFLDQVPIAIAVSDLSASERVVYANPEFEKLSGLGSGYPYPGKLGRASRRRPSPAEGSFAGRGCCGGNRFCRHFPAGARLREATDLLTSTQTSLRTTAARSAFAWWRWST